jgi:sialate O-acetylesterase
MRTLRSAVLPLLAGLLLLHAPAAFAEVKPHALITDGMVLQQGPRANVWGTADNGEEITVTFLGRDYKTTAKDGKWSVALENLKAGGPHELTIAGTNKLTIKNVLIGEVWVCSGQSNMEMQLQSCADPQKAIAESKNPNIHLFTVPHTVANTPQYDVKGKWDECNPDTVKTFSAVAYYFGRDLNKALDVPIGLIHTSWGGTLAEAWTSQPVLESDPQFKPILDKYAQDVKNYGNTLEKYAESLDKFKEFLDKYKEGVDTYKEKVLKAKAEGKEPPAQPGVVSFPPPPPHPDRQPNSHPSSLYNGMIAPLLPYAIKGAIWYQGESNAGKAYQYRTLFPAMIQNWRTDWKEPDFPFFFVQLAPWGARGDQSGVTWAELREAQLLTAQKLPKTGMAVITDVGDEIDIHPKQKEPVGGRLALAALAITYGKNVVYSGPVYDGMKVEGDKAVLSFKHIGGGLVAKGGPLQGFTIAGEDHKFVKAEAEIRDDKIVVWSKDVPKPVAVRFGWTNFVIANLFNKEGLPATPFRTDDFPMVTNPDKPKSSTGSN